MSQSPDPSPQENNFIPAHVVEQAVKNQELKLLLETQEIGLREKEIEANSRLAEKQMGHQAEILKARP